MIFTKIKSQSQLYDSDASAFFSAAGIVDNTQRTAINNLVVGLKSYNLWTKMSAVYPFIGGTASSHKYNLKDPRDLDIAHRILWYGSVTHDSSGIKSNGTTGYGNTNFNPISKSSSMTSFSMGVYKGPVESTGTSRYYLGSCAANGSGSFSILAFASAGTRDTGTVASLIGELSPTTSIASYVGSAIISTNGDRYQNYYKNGAKINSSVLSSSSFYNGSMYVLARNGGGTAELFTLATVIKFAFIGTGMSDSDAANMNTLITNYETELSRA